MDRAHRVPIVLLAALAGCGPDTAPQLAPIGDVSGYVGSEIAIMLRVQTTTGPLDFNYAAPEITDLKSRPEHPTITSYADGTAIFRWTPLGRDVGDWMFDFSASDGRAVGHEAVRITVDPAGGVHGPVFREPAGTGSTLDLSMQTCFNIDVLVDDPEVTHVTLGLGQGAPDGATLMQNGDFDGKLAWCPTQAQITAQDRWPIVLTADDGINPVAQKSYVLVLLTPAKPDCPGMAPAIMHNPPPDQTTLANLEILAAVTDDIGIKGDPLLYYSTTPPGMPPDLSRMTMLDMARTSGTAKNGNYRGAIPNPVAVSGGSQALYYVIVAQDNDDPAGTCDHTTLTGPFSFVVTAGGDQTVPYCGACIADAQCGPGNLCVRLGTSSDSFCMADCSAGQACPSGSSCSAQPVASISGSSRLQCLPDSGRCTGGGMTQCTDDMYEDNDHRLSIPNSMSHDMPVGDFANLMICPAGQSDNDEDWYRMDITAQTAVVARIDFDTAQGDLDLALVDGSGTVVRQSYGVGNSESVRQCITEPGIYYFHVFSFFPPTTNSYSMHLERNVGSCCVDDALEPNDEADHATPTNPAAGAPYTAQSLEVCGGNDDFYAVPLLAGETVTVDLTFTETNAQQDLDIHFYDLDGTTDLTPCPPCDVTNGQGTASNEHFERAITTSGTYFVVVRGYGGSTNSYSISIGVR